ncbi:MAG: hypothetical protein ABF248_06085 [Yoonia sp.]
MTNAQVLMIIAAFLVLTVGSFIWFIATWNAEAEEPVAALAFSEILLPEASL